MKLIKKWNKEIRFLYLFKENITPQLDFMNYVDLNIKGEERKDSIFFSLYMYLE
jgi:hypothetical protein